MPNTRRTKTIPSLQSATKALADAVRPAGDLAPQAATPFYPAESFDKIGAILSKEEEIKVLLIRLEGALDPVLVPLSDPDAHAKDLMENEHITPGQTYLAKQLARIQRAQFPLELRLRSILERLALTTPDSNFVSLADPVARK